MLLEKKFQINSKTSTHVSLAHDSLAFFLISICNIKDKIAYISNSSSELTSLKKKRRGENSRSEYLLKIYISIY